MTKVTLNAAGLFNGVTQLFPYLEKATAEELNEAKGLLLKHVEYLETLGRSEFAFIAHAVCLAIEVELKLDKAIERHKAKQEGS